MGILEEKRGLILGVANERSIAWAIAQAARREGARLGFSYFGEAIEKRVRPLAEQLEANLIEPLNVQDDREIDRFFETVENKWGGVDFVVHSIAFANKEALRGRFSSTRRADFLQALDVSCYSFIAVAQRAARLMQPGGSLLTLSYLGAVRAVPNYNVMGVAKAALEASTRYLSADLGREGIRVNALSSGPIRTLSASAIGGFKQLMEEYSETAALQRTVSAEEVANSAVYLLSDLASAVTGEIHYVDAGFHFMLGPVGGSEE